MTEPTSEVVVISRRFRGPPESANAVDVEGRRWRDFIRFRDRLRADPALAARYEAVKLTAAAKYPTGSRSRYSSAFRTQSSQRLRFEKRVRR